MVQMLTEDESKRVKEYADRWFGAQDVKVLSFEEREDLCWMLEKVLVGFELGELGFSDSQSGRLHTDSYSSG